MNSGQPTWEDLNAYVDGELTEERAAEVAAALGRDPALADQVAALHRLKGAAQGLVEEGGIDLPMEKRQAAAWLRSGMALAASLAMVFLLGGLWILLSPPPERHVVWATQAWVTHANWPETASDGTGHQGGEQTGALRLAQQKLGPAAYVPDLLSAGLSLDHVGDGPVIDGMPSLHLGYRGTRGCRLSLFLLAGGLGLDQQMLDLAPDAGSAGPRQAIAWQGGGFSTLLLAEGMDPLRFAEIARRLFRASLEQRPFDRETRLALQRSYAQAERCLT